MVKRILFAAALLAAFLPAWAAPSAKAWIFRLDNGQVISSGNADLPLPMASTTKLMTALIASEKPWQSVTVSAGDVAEGLYPCMSFAPGTELSRRDALCAMLMCSANELAHALGEKWGEGRFVAEMNTRARLLGMRNTRYKNTHGLDEDGHFSSARDIAILSAAVMKNPELREIVGQSKTEITVKGKPAEIESTFAPFLEKVPGAAGLKTGTTTKAGSCFAGAVRFKGHILYGTVLHSQKGKAYEQAAEEFESILAVRALKTVLKKGETFRADKDFDNISFEAGEAVELLLEGGEKARKEMLYTPAYPVRKGDGAALLVVTAPGYSESIRLYATETRLIPRRQAALTILLSVLCILITAYYFAALRKTGKEEDCA